MTRLAAWLLAAAMAAGPAAADDGELVWRGGDLRIYRAEPEGRIVCTIRVASEAARGTGERFALRIELAAESPGDPGVSALVLAPEPGPGEWTAELVSGDRRGGFGVTEIRLEDAAAHPFWQAAGTAPGFHLTFRGAEATVSHRFAAFDMEAALGHAAAGCGLDLERLPAIRQRREAAEAALALDAAALRPLRWRLRRLYAQGGAEPEDRGSLAEVERDYLRRFAIERGQTPSRYLSAELVRLLLREPYAPLAQRWIGEKRRSFRDWYYYETGRGGARACVIGTRATAVEGEPVWILPDLRLNVGVRAAEWGLMRLDLVSPSPFDPGAGIVARIGNARFALWERNGRVLPGGRPGRFDPALTRALVRARAVRFEGRDRAGERLAVEFSALGFTAAFSRMMAGCARPDVAVWIQ